MISGLLLVLLLATSTAGFGLLAMSQRQHRSVIATSFPRLSAPPGLQRGMGSVLLLASAALAIARDGVAFGLTIWVLIISLSAMTIVVTLTLLARRAAHSSQPDPQVDD